MKINKSIDLIGYGAVSVDDLFYISQPMENGTKIEVHHRERFGGGLTATALVAAARLNINPVFFGALGQDELSRFTRKELQKSNVNTDNIINKENAKPIYSTVIIDKSTGERTIFYSLEDFCLLSPNEIPRYLFTQAKYFFTDSCVINCFPTLISLAKENNTVIIVDIETDHVSQYKKELDAIEYLILNREIGMAITEKNEPTEILKQLETPERICTVITQGEMGCWYKSNQKPVYFQPAYPVTAVDTTGCGDVFHGAFAAALIHNQNHHQAIIWASAAAAIKAEHYGGRKGIPDLNTLNSFIKDHSDLIPRIVE